MALSACAWGPEALGASSAHARLPGVPGPARAGPFVLIHGGMGQKQGQRPTFLRGPGQRAAWRQLLLRTLWTRPRSADAGRSGNRAGGGAAARPRQLGTEEREPRGSGRERAPRPLAARRGGEPAARKRAPPTVSQELLFEVGEGTRPATGLLGPGKPNTTTTARSPRRRLLPAPTRLVLPRGGAGRDPGREFLPSGP